MPGIVRLNDKCTGHSCYPPRPCITASDDVFVEGKAVHREQDKWAMHACHNTPPHDGVLTKKVQAPFMLMAKRLRVLVTPFLAALKRLMAAKLFLRGK